MAFSSPPTLSCLLEGFHPPRILAGKNRISASFSSCSVATTSPSKFLSSSQTKPEPDTVGVRYVPKNNNSKKICFKLGNCGNCGNLLKSLEQQRGHTRSYSSYNLVILVTLVMSVTFGDSILCHPLK